jgi:hypothetical protein
MRVLKRVRASFSGCNHARNFPLQAKTNSITSCRNNAGLSYNANRTQELGGASIEEGGARLD